MTDETLTYMDSLGPILSQSNLTHVTLGVENQFSNKLFPPATLRPGDVINDWKLAEISSKWFWEHPHLQRVNFGSYYNNQNRYKYRAAFWRKKSKISYTEIVKCPNYYATEMRCEILTWDLNEKNEMVLNTRYIE